ncbi:MAG: hypothetical protein ACT4TC_14570 [Myxococcaceae bacterium]
MILPILPLETMLYAVLYMATPTQIYLTGTQRKLLDEAREREGKTLAQLVREAVDEYLRLRHPDLNSALEETFGALPDLKIPSRSEWARRG